MGLEKKKIFDIFQNPDEFWNSLLTAASQHLLNEEINRHLTDLEITLPSGFKFKIISTFTELVSFTDDIDTLPSHRDFSSQFTPLKS